MHNLLKCLYYCNMNHMNVYVIGEGQDETTMASENNDTNKKTM